MKKKEKLKYILKTYGEKHQLAKLVEECGEVCQAYGKFLNGALECNGPLYGEIADVAVGVRQLEQSKLFGEWMKECELKKIDRQIQRINGQSKDRDEDPTENYIDN